MELSHYKNMEPLWGVWKIRRLIGEGSFGKVFEIEREDFGRTYLAAMKAITIPQSQSELKSVLADGMDLNSATNYYKSFVEEVVDEFALMADLKGNSNIVSYEDHMVIEHKEGVGWDILIRMELLTPLLDYTSANGSIGRGDVIRLGMDICKALEYCRKMNVIHRDIKPENIFISSGGDYKLGDFGIARTVEKTTSGLSRKGTYLYMAPEVYKGEKYGPSVDIYSLGIVLYRLLNRNRAPFFPDYPAPIMHSDRENAIARRIGGEPIPLPCDARDALGEVILKACAYTPAERYATPEDMRLALQQVQEQLTDSAVHVTREELQKLSGQQMTDTSPEQTELIEAESQGDDTEPTADETPGYLPATENIAEDTATISMFDQIDTAQTAKTEEEEKTATYEDATEVASIPLPEPKREQPPEDAAPLASASVPAPQKPKKKKAGLLAAIIGIVIILLLLLVVTLGKGLLGGSSYADEMSTYREDTTPVSIFDETEEATDTETDEEVQTTSEEAASAENSLPRELLYGVYVYDFANQDTPFALNMAYEDWAFGHASVMPALVCFAPDGTMFHSADSYYTALDPELGGEALFYEAITKACGEEFVEESMALYEEKIRGNMDVAQMFFMTNHEEPLQCFGYYRLEGSKLEFYYPAPGTGNNSQLLTKQYDIRFTGRNLELTCDGITRTLVPYEFSADGEQRMSGYACSEEDALEGIACIHIEDILEAEPTAEIRFTDGSAALSPVVSLTGENTLTIKVNEKNINKVVKYLSCGEIGFILQNDGKNYFYQKTKASFYREKLSGYAADLYNDEMTDLDDDVLTAMINKKEEIGLVLENVVAAAGYPGNDSPLFLDKEAGTLTFSYDSLLDEEGNLTPEGESILRSVLTIYEEEICKKYSYWLDSIYMEVYLDSSEDDDFATAVSEFGANMLDDFCLSNVPTLYDYLETEGYGGGFPLYEESGEEDREASRRVVLRLTLDADAFPEESRATGNVIVIQ